MDGGVVYWSDRSGFPNIVFKKIFERRTQRSAGKPGREVMELVITVCEATLVIDAAVQNTHTHDICSPVFFLTENENLEIRPPQLSTPTNTNSPGSLRSVLF